eukprot:5756188-Pyramimonas_sp.AAC.2
MVADNCPAPPPSVCVAAPADRGTTTGGEKNDYARVVCVSFHTLMSGLRLATVGTLVGSLPDIIGAGTYTCGLG